MPSYKTQKSASERTSYFYYGDGGPKIIDINIVKCFKKAEISVNIFNIYFLFFIIFIYKAFCYCLLL